MASLWFTWTFDARTAGMGAFQRDRHQNSSSMSQSDLTPAVGPSPGSVRTSTDHGAARTDPAVTVRADTTMARGEPVTARTDPILARDEPITVRPDRVVIRSESVPARCDVAVARGEPLTPRTNPGVLKNEPERTRTDPIMVRREPLSVKSEPVMSGAGSSKTKTVTPKTEPATNTDDASTVRNDAVLAGGDAARVATTTDPSRDSVTDRTGTGLDSSNITKGGTPKTALSDDVLAEAVTFLGLLRHKEDELAKRTRQLMKRDRRLVQLLFCTAVEGWTPLHACTLRGVRTLVKMALKCGAPPDLEMGQPEGLPGHCSPLHLAAHRGDVSLLQVLVQGGASVNKRDGAGRTPLFYAASNHNTLAARKLIKYGADLADLSPQQRALYKEDIDRRSSTSFSCIPVQSVSSACP